MLQAIVKGGKVVPKMTPQPVVSSGALLIKTAFSCISPGTEMSGVAHSGKSLIRRALDQPENVKKVLNMAREQGIQQTLARVRGTLEAGTATGYSVSGIVIAVGAGVEGFKPGMRVAAAGAGIANHAEYVDVPLNLVAKLPEGTELSDASSVALGAIALQAVRRADIRLGEFVAVVGMGALGQLVLQMAKASGARVIAIDHDERRLAVARRYGAEHVLDPANADQVGEVNHLTGGKGCDTAIFTAATSNPEALSTTFNMTRRKGKVVMVGVYGKELDRADIYAKEIDFLISTSYGPGRYDETYERKGVDYPYSYVRWTENRNMQEYLRLLAAGAVALDGIVEREFPIERVAEAYESFNEPEKPLLVLLSYGDLAADLAVPTPSERVDVVPSGPALAPDGRLRIAIAGAGNFVAAVHVPNLLRLKDKFRLHAVQSRTSSTAMAMAEQAGAEYATGDYDRLLQDEQVDAVMIGTRHNLHGSMVLRALQAGKHVFVEKPLATSAEEVAAIQEFYAGDAPAKPVLMVGYNRRFSKYAAEVKRLTLDRMNPLLIRYRMNAGYLPSDHWVHTEEGGGRILGEGCHLLDLFNYLTGAEAVDLAVTSLVPSTGSFSSSDNKVITVGYADGSVATLEYFSIGSKEVPKELLEVHYDGKSLVLDNYCSLTGYGVNPQNLKSASPEKGHLEELEAFHAAITAPEPGFPIPLWDLFQSTNLALAASSAT